jgi:hypothetical protein
MAPSDDTPRRSPRERLAELYRLGGLKGVAAFILASVIGITLVVVDHFRPGFADRAMDALERRYPRIRDTRDPGSV